MFTVKYYLRVEPVFVFDTRMVPAEHYISYAYETDMFAYLNSHLLPTDVKSISLESDGENAFVVIVYSLDEETYLNMPPFQPICDDDMPF